MTRRTRFRRLRERGAFFTRKDAKAWRRLIREARAALHDIEAAGGDFALAAEAAHASCMPWPVIKGQETPEAFTGLIFRARQWLEQTPSERLVITPAVREAVEEVERILGPEPAKPRPSATPPSRRTRADIDG